MGWYVNDVFKIVINIIFQNIFCLENQNNIFIFKNLFLIPTHQKDKKKTK